MKQLSTVVSAALFVVATILVFIPELRTLPMRATFEFLSVMVCGRMFWYSYKSGVLTMTIGQIYRMPVKPKNSVLELIAILMSIVAQTLIS